jgi:hypothetical protein
MPRALDHIDDETELNISRAKALMGIAYDEVSRLMHANDIRSWYRGERLVTCRREIRAYHERAAERRAAALAASGADDAPRMTTKQAADEHYAQLFA